MPYAPGNNSMAKPHIRRANPPRGALIWFCFKLGEGVAWGRTPREAYGNWRKKRATTMAALARVRRAEENRDRRIDIGRYAGTYGGAHPDQEATKRPVVDSGHIIAGVLAFAIIVAGIMSAVMLWDAA